MKLPPIVHELGVLAKAAWRPFTGYAGAIALIVGLYVPAVTAEKMAVLATVVGGFGYLRSRDKSRGEGPEGAG